eukprot:9240776-Pyramimonas_sp.AAC.1
MDSLRLGPHCGGDGVMAGCGREAFHPSASVFALDRSLVGSALILGRGGRGKARGRCDSQACALLASKSSESSRPRRALPASSIAVKSALSPAIHASVLDEATT